MTARRLQQTVSEFSHMTPEELARLLASRKHPLGLLDRNGTLLRANHAMLTELNMPESKAAERPVLRPVGTGQSLPKTPQLHPVRNERNSSVRTTYEFTPLSDDKGDLAFILVEGHLRRGPAGHKQVDRGEDRFRALVTASSDSVYHVDPDWQRIERHSERDQAAKAESPNSEGMSFDAYFHPDDREMAASAIRIASRTRSPFQLEHRMLRSDDSVRWLFSRAVPLLDADNQITEWLLASTDITVRKHSENVLLRGEKFASLGRMAASITHEINNPLEAIGNLLFLAKLDNRLAAETRRVLEQADAELQRVAHITRQSLNFYRESNNPTPVSVTQLIDSVLELLASKFTAKRITIDKQYKTDGHIVAMPGEVRQIFSNLLTNSFDAIEPGGKIRIRVSPRNGHANGGVAVMIADNGSGIPGDIAPHVFEAFFTTKGLAGTGLGLWITRQLLEKQHGTIRLRTSTTPGRSGTAFRISLPANAA